MQAEPWTTELKVTARNDVLSPSWFGLRITKYFFKTCKVRFSLREERIKSHKMQQVTHKRGKE
jgi:hypothetical protein